MNLGLNPETITKSGSKITKTTDTIRKETSTCCDYSKNKDLAKKIGLWRCIKEYDSDTGKIKNIKVGLRYENPLELGDFVILNGSPKEISSQLKDAYKMADKGNSPKTIVRYFQALKEKLNK